jgi:hypothetical protein
MVPVPMKITNDGTVSLFAHKMSDSVQSQMTVSRLRFNYITTLFVRSQIAASDRWQITLTLVAHKSAGFSACS